MTPEKRIKMAICNWIKLSGGLIFVHDSVGIYSPTRKQFLTNHDPHRVRGVSDLIGIWKGYPLAIEVKSERGRLTDHQERFLIQWRDAGGIGLVARSIDDVKDGLEQFFASRAALGSKGSE